jgi:F0F1-type ATP synthase membrane subunit b/b'
MLRRDSSGIDPPERDESHQPSEASISGSGGIDIQQELDRIEELLFDSPRIPFTQRTLVDEETLLAQLDLVRANLPSAFEEAAKIVRQRDALLLEAEEYAQEIAEAAERRADQILDEMGIIQQAELEASQIRKQVQQECEALQEKTLDEIERMRLQAQQELEQLRQMALMECEDIQNGADEYADAVLTNIEQQLGEMLRIVRNGRQQLQGEPPSDYSGEGEVPPSK